MATPRKYPKQYPAEAIEDAFALYLRFHGREWHRIDAAMHRKGYVKFRASRLFPSAKDRVGWIEKYGWENALKIHLENLPTAALTNAQKLVREVEAVRKRLYEKIEPKGAALDPQILQLHRDYSKLSIEALTKVEAARDTLGGFVSFYERFIEWITDIDSKTARAILKVEDLIIERAEQEFGETEEMVYRRKGDGDGDENSSGPAPEPGAAS